jgi:CHAT domain-containing protein
LKRTLGEENSKYSTILENIARVHSITKEYSKSKEIALSSIKMQIKTFSMNKFGLTKSNQESYKQSIFHLFNFILNLMQNNIQEIKEIHKEWISINGILKSDEKQLEKMIDESNDVELKSLLIELKNTRLIKNKLNEMNNSAKEIKMFYYDSINERISFLEMELSRKSKSFESFDRGIENKDLINNLKNDEVFLDLISFKKINFDSNHWLDSTQYLVFISDSKDTLVDYVFIEDGTKIDQDLFDQYKQEATDLERKTDLKSEKFYNYFWKPIADKIGDAKTIYVSLGGVYNNINLNTIYNATTGKYLIEEKDIRIVNSARDFVLSKESEKKNYTSNTASLFGFPNFDGNTSVSADTSNLFASTRDLNSFWLDSLTRGGMKAKPLPATKTEVENISSTLKSKSWQVNSFLADNASETNIKKQQSPRILHVATHGYFFKDIPLENDNNRFLGMDRQEVIQDPMLRSGLLLTGANKTLNGETTSSENGLLSAAEASLLDLRETELVVLSACETGKGEVKNSEGVYGLRKAFSDAGAQNIIMSLWKVDDKVTQEFMSRFYEIWLNDKTTIREAFNKTQLEIKAKYPQPYYWGAFILVGE